MKKIKLLCVVGPTASGKTGLGIELAKKLSGEIVSADSMQIYKGIHIASAAPDEAEKQGIPHHLIEFLDPEESFTVAEYVELAHKTISEISARGALPIVVGGTGLYINSLIDGIDFVPQEFDSALRERLTLEAENNGNEAMLEKLRLIDPDAASKLHPNDIRRIIRAFEIYYSTGLTRTQADEISKKESRYDVLLLGLSCADRQKLYNRINLRVDIMLENGLVDEARNSLSKTTGGAVQAIGHKELLPYLSGEAKLCDAAEALKRATRRYAKRQLTWFRRDERVKWIYTDECDDPIEKALEIIEEWRN